MRKFQRYLEHNLTRRTTPENVTLMDAYKDGDESKLMAFMDFTRRTKVEWWKLNEQTASIWVLFRGQYESIIVTDSESAQHSVSTSILPYVREIERNQVNLQLREPDIAFCTSCYHMRTENEVLRAEIAKVTGKAPAPSGTLDREILRKWFNDKFHRTGYGRGFPRKQMRKELNDFLATIYGYKTELYSTSDLWKWFVDEVIADRSSQYRGFRVWRKSTQSINASRQAVANVAPSRQAVASVAPSRQAVASVARVARVAAKRQRFETSRVQSSDECEPTDGSVDSSMHPPTCNAECAPRNAECSDARAQIRLDENSPRP